MVRSFVLFIGIFVILCNVLENGGAFYKQQRPDCTDSDQGLFLYLSLLSCRLLGSNHRPHTTT